MQPKRQIASSTPRLSFVSSTPRLSFVIPILNEEDTIIPLFERIHQVLTSMSPPEHDFEVVLVNDGSTDQSWNKIKELYERYPEHISAVNLRRNFGKATALGIGLRKVKAEIVFTMDADLQDDPEEIPNFLAKLAEGFDCVSGWKTRRQDPWTKRLPSKLYNLVTSKATGIKLHDHNCGFKAYRTSALKKITLYGDLHRYLPSLIKDMGYKVTEIPVVHHPRRSGYSKYGMERYLRGFIDLLTVITITKYSQRPAHLISGIGFLIGTAGFLVFSYLCILWFVGDRPIGNRPLFQLSIMVMLASVQMIAAGLLAELLVSLTRSEQAEKIVEAELKRSVEQD